MKNKIWLLQIPVIAFFTFAFWVTEAGYNGRLNNEFLRTAFFPFLRSIQGTFTNAKFKIRGPEQPKNKIIIVDIDNASLEQVGRWPWHRDVTAALIENTFASGAKYIGLDIVFSEADLRVPEGLLELLKKHKLESQAAQFETDLQLAEVINKYKDKLVLGYITELECQPAYDSKEACLVTDPELIAKIPQGFEKFAYEKFKTGEPFNQSTTPLLSTPNFIANIPLYTDLARHAGYFNTWPDSDGYVRRTNLVLMANGKPYPSLALSMARLVLNEGLSLTLDRAQKIESINFSKSGKQIPVSPLGAMEINFRGPSFAFDYVSALDLLAGADNVTVTRDRKIASMPRQEVLKDAIVLIGLSALGVHDMRAFPFDSNQPGVEGHANILDNLLANDQLVHETSKAGSLILLFMMTAGALGFAYVAQRLESVPALLLFLVAGTSFLGLDFKYLFSKHINWNTSLFYIEISAIFVFIVAIKYVLEERNKKFIKGAFSKYVAPTIVDTILKDPTKLSVGGEKKELTILFSDIRGFTTFSEKMDAKALALFLNDYLGIMTDIVFDNEGTLDKYIGDAVMAFWGAPLDQQKHAANACKAAIKMMQALEKNRERFRTQYGVDVNIGIGINSGTVNVGNMGSNRIFEYTVIGDHVNLASRLEGLTKPYGASIVTTRFTFDDILSGGEELPPHRVLDFVKVKGKKKAVELIQVLETNYSDKGLRVFEEARLAYTKQNWDDAIEKFNKANELLSTPERPKDPPSLMYVKRCQEFKQNPPSADWDGSWEMLSK